MKMSILALLCVALFGFKQKTKPLITSQYAGVYSFGKNLEGPTGEVIIYPETDSTVLFNIDVCRGAPSYNLGQLYDRLKIKNGEGIYYSTDYNYSDDKKGCKWQVTIHKRILSIKTIDHCDNCGFGHAVYADHQYTRKDKTIHSFFLNMQGDTIYFSKSGPENYLR